MLLFCYTYTKSIPHINLFVFKKKLRDHEFDDDDDYESDELKNDGVVMFKGI